VSRFDIALSRLERIAARASVASGGRAESEASKDDGLDLEALSVAVPAADAPRAGGRKIHMRPNA